MSLEVMREISRKKGKIADIQFRSERSRQNWLKEEQDAVQELELYVAYALDMERIPVLRVAREVGVSRDKVQKMAQRARERNRSSLLQGTN